MDSRTGSIPKRTMSLRKSIWSIVVTRTNSCDSVWSLRCDGTLQAGIVGGVRFSFVVNSEEQSINVVEDDVA